MNIEQIKNEIPTVSMSKFEDILFSRVLGASRQTELIFSIFTDVISDEKNDIETMSRKISDIADYYKSTRGQNSRAIFNAIEMVLRRMKDIGVGNKDVSVYRNELRNVITSYNETLSENTDKAALIASKLAQNMNTIMIFDYSSTVNSFIKHLEGKKIIYIPESRALNGGKPFLKDAVANKHDVHFIPDTTMFEALKKCDAAFMGAETLLPDGSVFNTIGSDILAILCNNIMVPLYVISPLIKIDTRSIYGYSRLSPLAFDYSERLTVGWRPEEKNGIDFKGIKLVKIDGKYIEAICSEKGIIPSTYIFAEAQKLNDEEIY